MKPFLVLISVTWFSVCHGQKIDTNILLGKWRVCNSGAAPLVFIFSDSVNAEKGVLKKWNEPSDYIYKSEFTYKISDEPKENLTGNPAIDEMTFLLTESYKTLSNKMETQSFLVYIATKDSIGFILNPGLITPFCRIQ